MSLVMKAGRREEEVMMMACSLKKKNKNRGKEETIFTREKKRGNENGPDFMSYNHTKYNNNK